MHEVHKNTELKKINTKNKVYSTSYRITCIARAYVD